jgi:hypothetical protein
MRDTTPSSEPQVWSGAVHPHAEFWRPVQTFQVELACPSCHRGRLAATGEKGNVHACNSCAARWVVPGEPYPRRVERVDTSAQPMRGTCYVEA